MIEDPLEAALHRLERAVSRIETAGGLIEAPSRDLVLAYAALEERHGTLRLRIQETIDRLDALAGDPEPVTSPTSDQG